jgi:hypothetical protein
MIEYVCAKGCCEISVRLGPKSEKGGSNVNRPWLIKLNGTERTAEAWATQFGCSSSRVRNRINLGQCVQAKTVYVKREQDLSERFKNRVGLKCHEIANKFLRLRFV